jgi:hypothetical protein
MNPRRMVCIINRSKARPPKLAELYRQQKVRPPLTEQSLRVKKKKSPPKRAVVYKLIRTMSRKYPIGTASAAANNALVSSFIISSKNYGGLHTQAGQKENTLHVQCYLHGHVVYRTNA